MIDRTVSVIGLGYVGLSVAVAFGMKRLTIGFDINARRIAWVCADTYNTAGYGRGVCEV